MRFSSIIASSALALTASAAALAGHVGCLAPSLTEEQRKVQHQLASAHKKGVASAFAAAADVNVPTYVHVVSASQSASDGYLSRDTVNKQMQVLNQYYQGTGFQFTLQDVDWTVNRNWAYNGSEYAMKKALRKGDYRSLNLYYITDLGGGNTGYCYYPTNAPRGSDNFIIDGCIMSAWTAPGGIYNGNRVFSTGRITVHEVGHWSNLVHTFGETYGCDGPGDYVDDTPVENGPASGCDIGRDTCSYPGVDPIHNHMDYSYDNCRTEFTPGQIDRMQRSYNYWRRSA